MFNKHDLTRNECMLDGSFAKEGYDWWWHSFTAIHETTGKHVPFFIEYFLCNPTLGGKEPILGQLESNKINGIKPSYFMVKVGCWGDNHCQLHRFIGWDDVEVHAKAPFHVSVGNCYVSDTELRGSVEVAPELAQRHPEWMSDAGSMKWDLKVDKKIAFNVGYGASKLFRMLKAFEMYWHAEGMKSLYSGEIILNGEKYIVESETSYGYADKNWGRGFTSPWVWLSSNCMTSRLTGKELTNSVFDIGGGRPKVYFLALNRQLLSAFYYEGEEFEFNFSKFWTLPKTKFDYKETEDEIIWYVRQENYKAVMETEVHCLKKDMVLVNYEAPDGSKRHNRLWNGGNGVGAVKLYRKKGGKLILIDDIDVTHIGCEYGEYDEE